VTNRTSLWEQESSSHYTFIRTQIQKDKRDTALGSKDCRTHQPTK